MNSCRSCTSCSSLVLLPLWKKTSPLFLSTKRFCWALRTSIFKCRLVQCIWIVETIATHVHCHTIDHFWRSSRATWVHIASDFIGMLSYIRKKWRCFVVYEMQHDENIPPALRFIKAYTSQDLMGIKHYICLGLQVQHEPHQTCRTYQLTSNCATTIVCLRDTDSLNALSTCRVQYTSTANIMRFLWPDLTINLPRFH